MISTFAAFLAVTSPQTFAHTFVYQAEREHKSVHLAGTFNNWNKDAQPMVASGRTWKVSLNLDPGKHLYKFVLDGETWILDPKAAKNEEDGNGHTNSVLLLLPPDYSRPAAKGDGVVALSALRHQPEPPYLNWDRGALSLVLRARPADLSAVRLRTGDGRLASMRLVSADDLYARYAVEIPWNRQKDLSYSFELIDGKTKITFGPGGSPTARFKLSAKGFKPFVVPQWAQGAPVYQIFPDRFANGSRSNDPADVLPWDGKPTYFNRFGGDVAGVRSKVPYLKDLGVEAVYFNPIFASPSNHRYDATDFLRVDPQFGTNAEFAELTRVLQAQGIRTVLDGVFNHTATDFAPFADVVRNGERSPFVDWYTFRSFPVKVQENPNYVAWFGFPSMPKVNLSHPPARKYMLEIPRFWHRQAKISGWRLDVANEVAIDFWQDFRPAVKSLNSDNWIVGEVWGDGTPWLKGDQWDSIMGYQFRDAALRFIAEGKTTPTQFLDRLLSIYHSYPPQVSRNLMNLLSSHDTPRFLTLAGGDASLAKLGAIAQFTWPGSPSIYYGEELGMEGGPDPDNRRGMNWALAKPENTYLQLYKKLVALRRLSPSIRLGRPAKVMTNDAEGLAVYSRTEGSETAIVAINRSQNSRRFERKTSGRWVDLLSGRVYPPGNQTISIPERSAAILLPAKSTYLRLARTGFRFSNTGRPVPTTALRQNHKESQ